MAPPPLPAPGSQRRRFRILQTLGKGGFGMVYRAELTDAGGFSKQVALKVLHYAGPEVDEIARRLRDEARILGFIRHRAVVGVNSLVPLPDGWGVVMEYVAGVDLSELIQRSRPAVGASLEIVEEVAGALEAAYNGSTGPEDRPLRLIHRDIKPANIRVTRQGEVKLLDFGVARAELSTVEAQEQRGLVLGSSRYLAPERRQGAESHQGDVFALGVVLANMLTGKRFPDPPEDGPAHAAWLGTVLQTVKGAMEEADDVDVRAAAAQVRLLLLEMLAHDPRDRPEARRVEQRCRRIRTALPGPWLRDWAEGVVPRMLSSDPRAEPAADPDAGKVFEEQVSEVHRSAPAATARARPPWGWLGLGLALGLLVGFAAAALVFGAGAS